MTKPNGGGPAFPVDVKRLDLGHNGGRYEIAEQLTGLSLRDWFAGQALPYVASVCEQITWKEDAASMAYQLADAMLAERERGMQ